jgi:hypothetical protein
MQKAALAVMIKTKSFYGQALVLKTMDDICPFDYFLSLKLVKNKRTEALIIDMARG